MTNTNR